MYSVRSILKEIDRYKSLLIDHKQIYVRIATDNETVAEWLENRQLNEDEIILVNICW